MGGFVCPELAQPVALVELLSGPLIVHERYQVVLEEQPLERKGIEHELPSGVALDEGLAVIPFGFGHRARYQSFVAPFLEREIAGEELPVPDEDGGGVVEGELVAGRVIAMPVPYVHDVERFLRAEVYDAF